MLTGYHRFYNSGDRRKTNIAFLALFRCFSIKDLDSKAYQHVGKLNLMTKKLEFRYPLKFRTELMSLSEGFQSFLLLKEHNLGAIQ